MLNRKPKKHTLRKFKRKFRNIFKFRSKYYYNIASVISDAMIRGMPQLSVECTGGIEVKVSDEEANMYKVLCEKDDTDDDFLVYRAFVNQLEKKYLPRTIKYRFDFVGRFFNENKLRIYLRSHLWNSDSCNYSVDDIEIEQKRSFGNSFVVYIKLCL